MACTGLVRLKVEQVAAEISCLPLFCFFFLVTCNLPRQNYDYIFLSLFYNSNRETEDVCFARVLVVTLQYGQRMSDIS
jgi:hypothetical protein